MRTRLMAPIAAAVLLTVALSGCTVTGSSPSVEPGAASTSPSAQSASPTATVTPALRTATTPLGTIVVDGGGMTVYVFDADKAGATTSACTGACMTHWPAVNSDSMTPSVSGVTGAVSTITGNDGKLQVTLNGWPLYTWVGDTAAGDTTGQGLDKVWWVVGADGTKITN